MSVPDLIIKAYEQQLVTRTRERPLLSKLLAETNRPATPEEMAAHEAQEAASAARRAAREATWGAFLEDLKHVAHPLARAVLALHASDYPSRRYSECTGCDFAGYEGEPPEWPCRTVDLICDMYEIEKWEERT